MAVYTTPSETHEHYIERDTGSSAGVWAVIAVLLVLFAILFFGTNVFGKRSNSSTTDVNIKGSVQTPSTTGGASDGTTGATNPAGQ